MSVLSPIERAKIGIDGFVTKRKSRLCWLFHDWSRWVVTYQGDITSQKTNAILGKCIFQERQCQRCGKIEMDKQGRTI